MAWKCLFTPLFGGFWSTFPPNDVTHRPNPKKDRPWAEPRHLSHKPRKSVAWFELGVWTKKKDRTGQEIKSQKGYISPICGEAPTEAMCMKICVVGDVLDVITYAKFQNEIFRGYNFTRGRIFHFSYWFWMGLTTVQRYCAACDRLLSMTLFYLTCTFFTLLLLWHAFCHATNKRIWWWLIHRFPFSSAFQPLSAIRAVAEHFLYCNVEIWFMTLKFELDLNNVKMNQPAKYPGERSFSW